MRPVLSSLALAVTFAAQGACVSTVAGPSPQAADAGVNSTVSLLPDSAIAAIIRQRVESRKTPSIVVGVFDAAGVRFISYGTGALAGPAVLDGNSLFEIGSITKVFTTTILADMAARGEVRLDDPVANYLPPGTRVPSKDGRQISLLDLATHTSGLPRLPTNLSPLDIANPYVDYTSERMYEFLSTYELRRPVGADFEYSNFGVGLLGHALALRAGTDYETLVRARVLDPLGMKDTKITLAPGERARLAAGHNAGGQVVPAWDMASLAGAGALRSSAADMLRFLAANISAHVDSSSNRPLAAAICLTHETRRNLAPGAGIGLGWVSQTTASGMKILAHDRGTGGHRSAAVFDPARRVAVVVLSTSASDVNDIGRHLLDNTSPLARERVAVTLPPALLDGLVGEYALAPEFHITVSREGPQLFVQATGQGRFSVFAESESSVLARIVDAQITFARGADGKATALTLHQGGASSPAPRVK